MKNPYSVAIRFGEPSLGYWDHGHRRTGEFVLLYPYDEHPGKGKQLIWGSIELNLWFTARSGRSWKQAAAGAARRVKNFYPDAKVVVQQDPPDWVL